MTTLQLIFVLQGCGGTHSSSMTSLVRDWRSADGEAVFTVEEQLFSSLLENPNRFYEAMSTDTTAFRRFINHLQGGVITDYSGNGTEKLEKRRVSALNRLEGLPIDQQWKEMHQAVVGELKRIRAEETD